MNCSSWEFIPGNQRDVRAHVCLIFLIAVGTTMRSPLYTAPSLDNSLSLMVQNGRISTSTYLLPIVQPAYMRWITDCRMLSLAVSSGISLGWRFMLCSSRTNPVISISCSLLLRFWLVVWDLLRASAMRRSLPLTFCKTFSEDEQDYLGRFLQYCSKWFVVMVDCRSGIYFVKSVKIYYIILRF